GVTAAEAELRAEQTTIDRLATDAAVRPAHPTVVTLAGLIDVSPDERLAAARTAFSSGDLPVAVLAADDAAAIWRGAEQTGRLRLGLLALGLAFFGIALLAITRRRRPRRMRRVSMARPIA